MTRADEQKKPTAEAQAREAEFIAGVERIPYGYRRITHQTFKLEGKELADREAKVAVAGFYRRVGEKAEFLFASQFGAEQSDFNSAISVLTEDASRDTPKQLLHCGDVQKLSGCSVTFLGYVTMCKRILTGRTFPCVAVEDLPNALVNPALSSGTEVEPSKPDKREERRSSEQAIVIEENNATVANAKTVVVEKMPSDLSEMVRPFAELQVKCQATPRDPLEDQDCVARDKIGEQAIKHGWCYSTTDTVWYECNPDWANFSKEMESLENQARLCIQKAILENQRDISHIDFDIIHQNCTKLLADEMRSQGRSEAKVSEYIRWVSISEIGKKFGIYTPRPNTKIEKLDEVRRSSRQSN